MTSEVRPSWEEVDLGALCKFRAGSSFKRERQGKVSGTYPFIKVRDLSIHGSSRWIRDSSNWVDDDDVAALRAKPFPVGAVVFAKIGEALKANRFRLLGQDTLIDNNMMGAIPDPAAIDPKFFFYLLGELRLPDLATGSALPYLRQSDLVKVRTSIPPPDEQQRIAWVLGSLDDKIENNWQVATTLEEIATTLFKARFVDFVDHEDLVDSEVDKVPRNWSLVPVGDLARYVNGKAFTKFGNGQGRMVIRIAELRSGPGGSTVYTDHEAESDFMASPGDILFAWSGSLDVYRWYRPEALINQHIFKVIPEGYPAWFVFHALKQLMPHFQAIAADKATTMGHIKRGDLRTYSVAVPPASEMKAHDAVFAPLFGRALAARVESETLAQLRDRLLPKLISGSVRVDQGARVTT